jgi:hypothetical protein
MEHRKNEIIFEAHVEYYDSDKMRLTLENREIEEIVKRSLSEDLPRDMDTLFGLNVDVRVIAAREGSLTVFFGAVILGISRYKSLYDSIKLIQEQGTRILEAALRNRGRFSINVRARQPSMDSLEMSGVRWFRKHWPEPFDFRMTANEPFMSRDGFFYFLLVLCILEGMAIGLLVYKAVVKTYF